jgi:hypothetical protein
MLKYADNIQIGNAKWPRFFYQETVKCELDVLRSHVVGNIVFQAITAIKARTLFLLPPFPFLGKLTTGVDPYRGMTLEDATPKGAVCLNPDGIPVLGCRGTGIGSDVVLRYRPGTWIRFRHTTPASKADEVLVHELVHALRAMLGISHSVRLTGELADYDNVEEYYAIQIANTYLSEKGTTRLRGNHRFGKKAVMDDSTDTSDEFLDKAVHRDLIRQLVEEMPSFCYQFRRLPADISFNPIGRYLESYGFPVVPEPKVA